MFVALSSQADQGVKGCELNTSTLLFNIIADNQTADKSKPQMTKHIKSYKLA
jgi:hypothetical protein